MLQDLVLASSLSYLSLDEIEVNGNSQRRRRRSMRQSSYFNERRLQPLLQVNDYVSQTGATIFQMPNEKVVLVACRGTNNWKNFGTNLQFQLVDARKELTLLREETNTTVPVPASKEAAPLLVHTGFQQASIDLWKILQPALEQVWNQHADKSTRLVFTGHSLGAATALLCAVQYSLAWPQSQHPPIDSVLTFGGPRLVNDALAEYWTQRCFSNIAVVNLIHSKDPILQQNQPLWDALGFAVVGREVLCESQTPSIYPSVSTLDKTVLAYNFWDHCMYLGTFVGPRLLKT
jgi:predicted lipase